MPRAGDVVSYTCLAGGQWDAEVFAAHRDGKVDIKIKSDVGAVNGLELTRISFSEDPLDRARGVARAKAVTT